MATRTPAYRARRKRARDNRKAKRLIAGMPARGWTAEDQRVAWLVLERRR